MRFILLTPAQARAAKGETEEGNALAPRLVEMGEHAGNYVLPAAVLDDEAHAAKRTSLKVKPVLDLDPSTLWPAQEL